MTGPVLRPATNADAGLLAGLHRAAFAEAWTAKALADLVAAPGAFALIADGGAGPQGFVLARVAAGEAEVLTIAVHPQARRGGLGRALVLAAALEAAALGAEALFLEVAVDNAPALGLYTALGFAEAGRRKAYYGRAQGPAVDALTLKMELPGGPGRLGNAPQPG